MNKLRYPRKLAKRDVALVAVTAVVTAALSIPMAVSAAIPGASGAVHTCYDARGALRVIDSEAGETCRQNESSLILNQQRSNLDTQVAYVTFRQLDTPVGERLNDVDPRHSKLLGWKWVEAAQTWCLTFPFDPLIDQEDPARLITETPDEVTPVCGPGYNASTTMNGPGELTVMR